MNQRLTDKQKEDIKKAQADLLVKFTDFVNEMANTQTGTDFLRWVYSQSKNEIDFSNPNITISRDAIVYSEAIRRMYQRLFRQFYNNETILKVERKK